METSTGDVKLPIEYYISHGTRPSQKSVKHHVNVPWAVSWGVKARTKSTYPRDAPYDVDRMFTTYVTNVFPSHGLSNRIRHCNRTTHKIFVAMGRPMERSMFFSVPWDVLQ